MDMVRQYQNQAAGHPSPQGVEKYGGVRKIRIVFGIERDIPIPLIERYGIPISLRVKRLVVEDENGRRIYEDILYAQGGWKKEECVAWGQYEYIDVGAEKDLKTAEMFIKAMLKYEPRKGNAPKVPVEIEIMTIDFDWEIRKNGEEKLWRFEVFVKVRYYWENGVKTIRLFIKFPNGEIDAHPLTKIYWENYIINSVAEFIRDNDIFNPQPYLKGYLTKGGNFGNIE